MNGSEELSDSEPSDLSFALSLSSLSLSLSLLLPSSSELLVLSLSTPFVPSGRVSSIVRLLEASVQTN